MDRKSLALFGLAVIAIASMVAVSACTTTATPPATPTATPSPSPSATPTAIPNATAAFNQSDNNRTVNARSGETFTVTLVENPSTGYAWNVTVTDGLTIINDTYLPPANTSLVGAPGLHEWLVEATGTGDQKFSGIYKRPQEALVGNETTYVLNVNVSAPMLGFFP